jgi:hypothetical protein
MRGLPLVIKLFKCDFLLLFFALLREPIQSVALSRKVFGLSIAVLFVVLVQVISERFCGSPLAARELVNGSLPVPPDSFSLLSDLLPSTVAAKYAPLWNVGFTLNANHTSHFTLASLTTWMLTLSLLHLGQTILHLH